ncbi:MAG: cyclase family protein [Gemmatimonadetes bacterium]|nr:cyclase family protein [Gemmatimonadota bacterium]
MNKVKSAVRSVSLWLVLPIMACSPDAQPEVSAGGSAGSARGLLAGGRLVDLTHSFDETTPFWPTAEPFRLEVVTAGMTDQGYYYAANNLSLSEHGGTHLDAPVHFAEGRRTTDQIPLEQLVGPGAVVDVSVAAAADPDYQVTTADLQAWEAVNGRLPDGAIVLLNTDRARFWPDAEQYMGTAQRGEAAVAQLHFPGLHPDAARWLVENRSIAAVGLDTPSIDYGQSTAFESHRILFAANIPAFENVASLVALPATGSTIIALPMKIAGGTGGPLRIIAVVPE